MRGVHVLTSGFAFSSDRPWLPGLPHMAAALPTYFVFGAQDCVTGLMLATLASFVVYLPVTALWLNGGRAIAADATAPVLTTQAQVALFWMWAVTAWAAAGLTALSTAARLS